MLFMPKITKITDYLKSFTHEEVKDKFSDHKFW